MRYLCPGHGLVLRTISGDEESGWSVQIGV